MLVLKRLATVQEGEDSFEYVRHQPTISAIVSNQLLTSPSGSRSSSSPGVIHSTACRLSHRFAVRKSQRSSCGSLRGGLEVDLARLGQAHGFEMRLVGVTGHRRVTIG